MELKIMIIILLLFHVFLVPSPPDPPGRWQWHAILSDSLRHHRGNHVSACSSTTICSQRSVERGGMWMACVMRDDGRSTVMAD
eukprot:7912398-Pyramimonas_sp.AAC.1